MEIYKDLSSPASQEFEKLLNSQLSKIQIEEGKIIEGKINKITEKFVFIFVEGLKSEPVLDINELKSMGLSDKIKIGENIPVLLEKIEDRHGNIRISREKARRQSSLQNLKSALEKSEEVTGTIVGRTKGGAVVDINSCLAFLPGSQFCEM